MSGNVKFLKTQLSKIVHSGGILGELLVALPYATLKSVNKKSNKIASNKIKDVTKVIKSLKNRYILLKETTRKITS